MKTNKISRFYRQTNVRELQKALNIALSECGSNGNNLSVLEIGCGPCIDLYYLLRKNKEVIQRIDFTGVDLSSKFIQECRKNFGNFNFIVSDAIEFLSNSNRTWHFIITSFGVINHFNPEELSDFFKVVSSKLETGGLIFISFLNRFALNEWIYFLFTGKLKSMFRRLQNTHVGFDNELVNQYYYSLRYIKKTLKETGYSVLWSSGAGIFVPPPYVNVKKRTFNTLVLVENFIRPFFYVLSDLSIVVVRKEK